MIKIHKQFICKENLEEIIGFGMGYGLAMLLVFGSANDFGVVEMIKSSSTIELAVVAISFWLFGAFSMLIIFYQIYFSFKVSELYARLGIAGILIVYLVFTFELFDFYWISIYNYSRVLSGLFSGLFFSPFAILILIIFQKIVFSINPRKN